MNPTTKEQAYERGSADAYYGRPRRPNCACVMTAEQTQSYHAGYSEQTERKVGVWANQRTPNTCARCGQDNIIFFHKNP